MTKKSVIFFRSEDLPQDFSSSLSPYFTLSTLPVLSFSFSEFSSTLQTFNFSPYDCIIFPSKRAVEAIHSFSIPLPNTLICSVGESTSSHLQSLLHINPHITGTQGAKHLVSLIISAGTAKNVLYLCGDNQNTLPFEDFHAAGIEVKELVCYSTRQIKEEELKEAVNGVDQPDICVFFSPSGVRSVAGKIMWDWGRVALVAIGTTTADALVSAFGKCDGVPSEFNLTGLQNLLIQRFV